MVALYFLKFLRPTTTTHKDNQPFSGHGDSTTEIANSVIDMDNEFGEEEDDSFFELELTVPDFDNNRGTHLNNNSDCKKITNPPDKDVYRFDSKAETCHYSANKAGNFEQNFQQPTLSLSPSDLLSKRKILPIEPTTSKPQSPISLLKSAPTFKVLMFKRSKSMASHRTEETGEKIESASVFVGTQKNKRQQNKFFTVKFKLEEGANFPIFTRDNSLRRQITNDSLSDSSKRFSKEVIQKYLKLIKPLYIKVSRKQSEKVKSSGELSVASPSSSPATLPSGSPKKEKQGNIQAGFRVVCKHLGKSKSASATTTTRVSQVNRRDDSLLLQHDGIQSAILHCKKSFNSSRDSSLLSRRASEHLNEKFINIDSPRISSEEI